MDSVLTAMTLDRRDAVAEPPWMGSRRVMGVSAGCMTYDVPFAGLVTPTYGLIPKKRLRKYHFVSQSVVKAASAKL